MVDYGAGRLAGLLRRLLVGAVLYSIGLFVRSVSAEPVKAGVITLDHRPTLPLILVMEQMIGEHDGRRAASGFFF